MTGPMGRRWRFTLQPGHLKTGTLEEWEAKIRREAETINGLKFIAFQQEVGEQQGGHHIQGYIHFERPKRPSTIGNLLGCLPETFQTCNGTPQENKDYCTKDETRKEGCTPFIYGEVPAEERARNDLKRCAELISTNGLDEAIEQMPEKYVQYPRGMESLAHHYKTKKLKTVHRNVEVMVIYGAPGSGKSYWAQTFNPNSCYTLPVSRKGSETWFNNYNGEITLIIEDFNGRIDYRSLLQMLDNYPCQVQTKGSHVWAEWQHVIITSNNHPNSWYGIDDGDFWNTAQSQGPLQRRIDEIIEMRGTWPEVEIYVNQVQKEYLPTWKEIQQHLAQQEEAPTPPTVEIIYSTDESPIHQPFENGEEEEGVDWDELDQFALEQDLEDDILKDIGLENPYLDLEAEVQ